MYNIAVRQYILPHGHQRDEIFETDDKELYDDSCRIIKAGGRYEAEVLRTGHVSVTVHYDDEDIAIEVCNNGPEVIEAMRKITTQAINFLDNQKKEGDTTSST